MRVAEIIDAMGGRASVARLTGVGAPQISHMFTRGSIPEHHIRLFIALRPELDWAYLLNGNTRKYISVLTEQGVRNVRYARLRVRERVSV
jgi:DNA-binding transcriptional regulator YdaS (Cro superfamily)